MTAFPEQGSFFHFVPVRRDRSAVPKAEANRQQTHTHFDIAAGLRDDQFGPVDVEPLLAPP